jgi:hypothetical protein
MQNLQTVMNVAFKNHHPDVIKSKITLWDEADD